MPAPVLRQVLRGTGMTVGAIVDTVAAGLAAPLAGVRVETWGLWFGLLVGLLALTGALTFGAAVSLVEMGEMIGRCLPRLGERLAADSLRLDAALRSSRLSPRRRP